jgi:hypothetical protein
MNPSGLEVFDETVQKTNAWLKGIAEALSSNRHRLSFATPFGNPRRRRARLVARSSSRADERAEGPYHPNR